jgi:hypothetical protein
LEAIGERIEERLSAGVGTDPSRPGLIEYFELIGRNHFSSFTSGRDQEVKRDATQVSGRGMGADQLEWFFQNGGESFLSDVVG